MELWVWAGIIIGAILVATSFRDRRWIQTILGLTLIGISTFGGGLA